TDETPGRIGQCFRPTRRPDLPRRCRRIAHAYPPLHRTALRWPSIRTGSAQNPDRRPASFPSSHPRFKESAMTRTFVLLAAAASLAGCATPPKSLRGDFAPIAPGQVANSERIGDLV